MARTLKGKITLGLFFLLLLLLLSGGTCIYFLYKLRIDSKAILKDNYETLHYCHDINVQLNDFPSQFASSEIDRLIGLQENNVTESGEKEALEDLKLGWIKLKQDTGSAAHRLNIRKALDNIQQLNMSAIKRKSAQAESTADKALLIIVAFLIFILLLALLFMIKFPAYITRPLRELADGIREIANKNYNYRIEIKKGEELKELADAFNNMSEKLNEYEKQNMSQLLFEKARAEAVINSLKDASIGIDNEARILFANPQATQLLGIRAEDVIGRYTEEVASFSPVFHFIVHDDRSSPFRLVVNGSELFFVKEKNEVKKENKIMGTLFTVKNVTTFQEKDIAKTNFLATISHELKTPLSSTDIALKLLTNKKIGTLNAEQLKIIENISRENERLISLVSELLDLSQAETGKINLQMSTVPLLDVLDQALSSLQPLLSNKLLKVKLQGMSNRLALKADKEKTRWVLVNVLTNAIRHSPDGSEIRIEAQERSDRLVLSVHDSGPGIPEEFRQSIFKKFYKLPGNDADKGSGLGLFIAKEFMEAMNGKIGLDPHNADGAKFNLEFQRAA